MSPSCSQRSLPDDCENLRVPAAACDALIAKTQDLIAVHYKHWRKDVRDPGQDRALSRMVIERLCALGLARREGDLLLPLPAIGRYGLRDEEPAEPAVGTKRI